MDTTEEISAMDSATIQIPSLSSAINNLLDIVSSKWDFISPYVYWPSNFRTLNKGLLAQGMLWTQLTKSFTEAKERTGFSILSLIPPIKGCGNKPEGSSLHNTELRLKEALENLTKVDATINIDATVLPQTGLFICANTVLL